MEAARIVTIVACGRNFNVLLAGVHFRLGGKEDGKE